MIFYDNLDNLTLGEELLIAFVEFLSESRQIVMSFKILSKFE